MEVNTTTDPATQNPAQDPTTAPEGDKTFTQEQVNAIIADRLARERGKYSDYEDLKKKAAQFDASQEAGKSELQKATDRAAALQAQVDAFKKAAAIQTVRDSVSKETGVPAALLYGEDEDSCKAQAEAIKAFVKQGSSYPNLPDGGDPKNKPTGKTRDQFANWFGSNFK